MGFEFCDPVVLLMLFLGGATIILMPQGSARTYV